MDRCDVIERRRPVGIADGDVMRPPIVSLENGQNAFGRKAMNRRHDGRRDKAAVAERAEVEVIVNEVELAGALKAVRYVEARDALRIDR